MAANEKLRRTVHKLVLINRFNKNAGLDGPIATGASGTQSNAGTMQSLINTATRGKWGQGKSRRLIRVMDDYIKEQSDLYQYAATRAVVNDEGLPWYILQPDSRWRMLWDVLILILVVFSAFSVPIHIGFEVETSEAPVTEGGGGGARSCRD